MLKILFTLDYEIHGNGEGNPRALIVEPTQRMLNLFDRYGAKLTIMADVAEVLKFKEYLERTGSDRYCYEAIAKQLRDAIRRNHDVQLHLHASYFNARHANGRWAQDWSEYNFAGLESNRMNELVRIGKQYLEDLLKPVSDRYECTVFRAANWSVSPSRNVVRALIANRFKIDSSIFKYGQRTGLVNFDYNSAYSELIPWPAGEQDICAPCEDSQLWEFPIYSEQRYILPFLTHQRIYRALLGRLHKFSDAPRALTNQTDAPPARDNTRKKSHWLVGSHAWKADFNQCTGRQLIKALKRADTLYGSYSVDLPFVLIGHSKLFTRLNEWSLRPFLSFVADHPDRFAFATFRDFDLALLRTLVPRRSSEIVATRELEKSKLDLLNR